MDGRSVDVGMEAVVMEYGGMGWCGGGVGCGIGLELGEVVVEWWWGR